MAAQWAWHELVRALADVPGLRAHPLHHQPSARHGGRSDRSAWRHSGKADAVPAFAGAIRLGPHTCRDEPQAIPPTSTAALVGRLRAAKPDLACRSDFIVGHPGETDADHAQTMALVRDIGFASGVSRSNTQPAPRHPRGRRTRCQVPEPVKDARLQELQAALRDSQAAFNAARAWGSDRACAGHRAGPPPRPVGRPHPRAAAGAFPRVLSSLIGTEMPGADRRRHPHIPHWIPGRGALARA